MKHEAAKFSMRKLKYPLFILGLAVMIAGGLVVARIQHSLYSEVIVTTVGFVLMFLGIVIE